MKATKRGSAVATTSEAGLCKATATTSPPTTRWRVGFGIEVGALLLLLHRASLDLAIRDVGFIEEGEVTTFQTRMGRANRLHEDMMRVGLILCTTFVHVD